uniref:Uncharacterized protein n=1 Tax=Oryza sativa subsp. japonica TaxID=39947 RepID=Q6ZLI1_ORYSJ|nr:hypothetical protein [Oryza sativa Japonica Group]
METDEPATKAAGGEPKPSPATKAAGEQEEDDEEESSGGGGTEPEVSATLPSWSPPHPTCSPEKRKKL